jgi:GT2 family glycosyltransferase
VQGNTDSELAIVLVAYNCEAWLGRCLKALPSALAGRSADVVVVDNASSDDSAEVASAHHGVTLIRNHENLGFAAAVNQGVRASSARWVLLLNPDTDPGPGAIDNLLTFALAHPENRLYGGRTLREDGTLDPASCWGLPSLWSTLCFALGLTTAFRGSRLFDPESLGRWQRDSVREVGMVAGCLMLVGRDTWDELGGLDESYFVYGEDADFNARARKLGASPIVVPSAQIVHAKGVSSGSSHLPLLLSGKITFARKHFPQGQATLVVWMLRSGTAVRAVASRALVRETIWTEAWVRRSEWWSGFPQGAVVRQSSPGGR